MALADDERRRTSFGTVVGAGRYDDLRPGCGRRAVSGEQMLTALRRSTGDDAEVTALVVSAEAVPLPDAVAALASTCSGITVREDRDDVLDQVRALAAGAAGPDGAVVVPMVCHCFRCGRP